MSAKSETDDLQKNLLNIFLFKSPELRRNYSFVKEEWFTTDERRFLFKKIIETFKSKKSQYTKILFDFDLQNEIDPAKHIDYIECWNYIFNKKVIEKSDAIIQKLKNYENKQKAFELISSSVELFQSGNINDTLKKLRSELSKLNVEDEDIPVATIRDYEDVEKTILDKRNNPELYKGLKTGFPLFDKIVGGLFAAELTLFAAVTGVGKSTIMKQVAYNVIKQGKNVLHITNEENLNQVKMKYESLMTEVQYNHLKNPEKLSDEDLEIWRTKMKEIKENKFLGELIIKEIPQFTDATLIEKEFASCNEKGIRIDLIVIDYLDQMKPIQQAYNENDEQAKITADVKGLAISCNVPIISATQASTIAEEKQERGKSFGKYDIYGSKRKVHATNTLIFVIQTDRDSDQAQVNGRGGTREEHECDWFWKVEIAKNRDGPNFNFACRQHVLIGKVEPMAKDELNAHGKKIMDELSKVSSVAGVLINDDGTIPIDVVKLLPELEEPSVIDTANAKARMNKKKLEENQGV